MFEGTTTVPATTREPSGEVIVATHLRDSGIGEWDKMPTFCGNPRGQQPGQPKVLSVTGSYNLLHTNPEGVQQPSAEVVKDKYEVVQPRDAFATVSTLLNTFPGVKIDDVSFHVKSNKQTGAPEIVRCEVLMPYRHEIKKRRGDIHQLVLVVEDAYTGKRSCSIKFCLRRVACENMEMFFTETMWASSKKHVSGLANFVTEWASRTQEFEQVVTKLGELLDGLDTIDLGPVDFERALHYVLSGSATSSLLLKAANEAVDGTQPMAKYTNVVQVGGEGKTYQDANTGCVSTSSQLFRTVRAGRVITRANGRDTSDRFSVHGGTTGYGLLNAMTSFQTHGITGTGGNQSRFRQDGNAMTARFTKFMDYIRKDVELDETNRWLAVDDMVTPSAPWSSNGVLGSHEKWAETVDSFRKAAPELA